MTSWSTLMFYLTVAISVTPGVGSFCNFDFVFHDESFTCIKLMTFARHFKDARRRCKDYNGGNLVTVLDASTNRFLKDMLSTYGEAWIGLDDLETTNHYYWNDETPLGSFTDWAGELYGRDNFGSGVVITKDGWKEKRKNDERDFFCQTPAVLTSQILKCPEPLQEGAESKAVCSVKDPGWESILWSVTTHTSQQNISSFCKASDSKCPSQMTITNLDNAVTESDLIIGSTPRDANISCTFYYRGNPSTKSCIADTYYPPDGPRCSHSFHETTAIVNCTTSKVYPKATCDWTRQLNDGNAYSRTSSSEVHSERFMEDGLQYFRTTCSLKDDNSRQEGNYTYKMTMYPDMNKLGPSHVNSTKREMINFTIRIPEKKPLLAVNTKAIDDATSVTVRAGEMATIDCTFSDGEPKPYQTRIWCDREIDTSVSEYPGPSATKRLNVTRSFKSRTCSCTGRHIARNSLKTTSVAFHVEFKPEITQFSVASKNPDQSGVVEVYEGNNLVFCKVEGNPEPELVITKGTEVINLENPPATTRQGTSVSVQVDMKCEMWDTITCMGKSNLGETIEEIRTKVICKPKFCDSETDTSYGLKLGKRSTVRICIVAYPDPDNSLTIYKDHNGRSVHTSKDQFQVGFERTENSFGYIVINVTGLTEKDLGAYKVYVRNARGSDYLNIELKESDRPKCPTLFKLREVGMFYASLEWIAGHNGGSPQTFTVQNLNNGEIQQIEGQQERANFEANITGLKEDTTYTFVLEAENVLGKALDCNTLLNATTAAAVVSETYRTVTAYLCTQGLEALLEAESLSVGDDNNVIDIIIPVTVCLVLAIVVALLIIVVVLKRRMKPKNIRDEDDPASPAYAVVKDTEVDRNNGDIEEINPPDATYAVVDKKKKTGNSGKAVSKTQGNNTEAQAEVTYSNMAALREEADDEAVYNNVPNQHGHSSTEDKTGKNTTEGSGRYQNQDGLVYVTVELNPVTSKPMIKSANTVRDERYEPVEYSTIVPGQFAKKEETESKDDQ